MVQVVAVRPISSAASEAMRKPVWLDARSAPRSPDADGLSPAAYHRGLLCKHVEELAELADDWDGYGGTGPSVQTVGNVHRLLTELSPDAVQRLHQESLTPTPYGTITLEWEAAPDRFLRVEMGDTEWAYFYEYDDEHGDSGGNVPYPDAGVLGAIHELLAGLYGFTVADEQFYAYSA